MERREFTAEDWEELLARELGRRVRVRYGRARRQVIVAHEEGETLVVRMNAVFGTAPEDVRHAVARWLLTGRRARAACARLDGWIEEAARRLPPARRTRIRADGLHHDLTEITAELLRIEFTSDLLPTERRPRVTWGRRGSRRARRSLQLGSFDPEAAIVRVHPVLDQAAVPRFVVRYVLFHEHLHAALEGAPDCARSHHPPRFRRRERAYPDYERALRWQRQHLRALLASARTGEPMPLRPAGRGALERAWRRLGAPGQGWLFADAAPDR